MKLTTLSAITVCVTLLGSSAVRAQNFSINWYTIEPGGHAAGGTFSLDSTIGQPDAGPMMAGGTFQLTGGFLVFSSGNAGCDPIDFNRDGLFPDTLDIDDFLSVFAGGACSTDPSPGCNDIDFNNDGLFPDTEDIDAFLRVFAGSAC